MSQRGMNRNISIPSGISLWLLDIYTYTTHIPISFTDGIQRTRKHIKIYINMYKYIYVNKKTLIHPTLCHHGTKNTESHLLPLWKFSDHY